MYIYIYLKNLAHCKYSVNASEDVGGDSANCTSGKPGLGTSGPSRQAV